MWAITITLKPKMYKYTLAEQHKMARDEMMILRKYYDVTIIAEITKSFNIHYHGVAKIRDMTLLTMRGTVPCHITDMFRKSNVIGFVNVKPYSDRGWIRYIVKDTSVTVKDLQEHPVICDDLDILRPILSDYGIAPTE